jgi:hypothetical protein
MPKKSVDPMTIKPDHKAIRQYHDALKEYRGPAVLVNNMWRFRFQALS